MPSDEMCGMKRLPVVLCLGGIVSELLTHSSVIKTEAS